MEKFVLRIFINLKSTLIADISKTTLSFLKRFEISQKKTLQNMIDL